MRAAMEAQRLMDQLARGEISPDEPLFMLRANDCIAAPLVREWIQRASDAGAPLDKTLEASALLSEMLRWPHRQIPGHRESRITLDPK
mgnify:CR=1 FL=1